MSEDLTRQLPDDALAQILGAIRELGARMESFERRMDAFEGRMDSFERRMEKLERKVDERLYDTRPIWEKVVADVEQLRQGQARVEEGLARVAEQQQSFAEQQQSFAERLERLEAGQQRLSREFEDGWRRFERKLRAMSDSWLELKADYTYLDRRLGELEEPPA